MNDYVLILCGTVSGNAELCARRAAKQLEAEGLNAVVRDIINVPAREIQDADTLLISISTAGNGEPPDSAIAMWEALVRDGSFNLSRLRYSVLVLGDSSFPNFCQCGRDFDVALERQGARRLAPRVDSDRDYENSCATWIESVVRALRSDRSHPLLNSTI